MSDTIRLRDHSRPCEHGSLWPHTTTTKGRWWRGPECLGGKEVILQRVEEGLWREAEDSGAGDAV
jgi:hypothetical protein